jgi:hypothetical protein
MPVVAVTETATGTVIAWPRVSAVPTDEKVKTEYCPRSKAKPVEMVTCVVLGC